MTLDYIALLRVNRILTFDSVYPIYMWLSSFKITIFEKYTIVFFKLIYVDFN